MSDYGLLLEQFGREVAVRNQREAALKQFASAPTPDQIELQGKVEQLQAQQAAEVSQLEEEYQSVRSQTAEHFAQQLERLEGTYHSLVRSIQAEADNAVSQLEKTREESVWVVTSVLDDSADDSPLREFEKLKSKLEKTLAEQSAHLAALNERYQAISAERNWTEHSAVPTEKRFAKRDAACERFNRLIEESDPLIQSIRGLLLPRLFRGFRSIAVFAALTILTAIPIFLFVDPALANVEGDRFQAGWIGISAIAGVVSGLLLTVILYSLGAMRQADLFRQLEQLRADAAWTHHKFQSMVDQTLHKAERRKNARQQKIEGERDEALTRFENAHSARRQAIETDRTQRLQNEADRYHAERDSLTTQRDQQLAKIDNEHQQRMSESETRWGGAIDRVIEQMKLLRNAQSRQFAEMWSTLKSNWDQASKGFFDTIDVIRETSDAANPDWESINEQTWTAPQHIPTGFRFGQFQVDLNQWPGALSDDVRLAPRSTQFEIPAGAPFPGQTSVLLKSSDADTRAQTIEAIQSMLLRMLLLMPPGKLRLTLLDPVGLGESFAGFMHLADYDELLVSSRIWTEAGQIETQLADLTAHMENVFQTYLRNEFQTIEDYNASAGEVAEPYRVLVISDFPSKFSEIAARRLTSIIQSGPRCGVYTILGIDPTKSLPNNFDLSDIEPHMVGYAWQNGRLHAEEPALAPWPIEIDSPPEPQRFTSLVKMVGEASKDARHVEVSFERIAPDRQQIWSRDARHELEIPLGRAGATKLQTMRLGKGTSQHMLVAGKTGSGKSTFMHIVVTNLALHYSPDEVNFFLIDFKKGVEFKEYATQQLPHAKVIAIESDREFGVSALQRLDEILQERGELFRRHGVQDIAGFRNANPDHPMPRIVLLVDEFQEFFIEDDKLGQTAALLLDRLVRQGRAFGIHVVLGSQTLGGAYSLARTTLGQVAVRVALQCSDADAHLILSEDNTAARLLNRPGEAIYNDANGLVEGNHPFQIAWLGDEERRTHLQAIRNRMQRDGRTHESAVVFEGNVPSEISMNAEVRRLADEFQTREAGIQAPRIWLGDAVEIQPPTSITFHRQNGAHLLIVGQDSDSAMGMMTTSVLTLAASTTLQSTSPVLYLFDENPAETGDAQYWRKLIADIPAPIKLVTPREVTAALNELDQELQRRRSLDESEIQPLFVVVHNIAKFRELRKPEDDFGLGGFGTATEEKPAEPGKLFATLLEEGPIHGIHCLIWCDSYNNVERCFSRQSLKELELRVALQMNAADSSNLIETPAASRLGSHRALLYRDESGISEKFRPYGTPHEQWLNQFIHSMKHGPERPLATDLEEFSIL